MTEAAYQSKLIATFRHKGWHVLKLIKVSVAGYPDLQLTHPDRPTVYIEVKSDVGRLSEIQKYRHEQLKKEGFTGTRAAVLQQLNEQLKRADYVQA